MGEPGVGKMEAIEGRATPLYSADDYGGRGHGGSRGAGGDHPQSGALCDQLRSHRDRGTWLLPDGPRRVIGHADHLGSVDYRETGLVFGQLGLDQMVVTDQHNVDATPGRLDRACNRL